MSIRDELAAFLVEHGLAEERPGYGHATGGDIADALLGHFDIRRIDDEDTPVRSAADTVLHWPDTNGS